MKPSRIPQTRQLCDSIMVFTSLSWLIIGHSRYRRFGEKNLSKEWRKDHNKDSTKLAMRTWPTSCEIKMEFSYVMSRHNSWRALWPMCMLSSRHEDLASREDYFGKEGKNSPTNRERLDQLKKNTLTTKTKADTQFWKVRSNQSHLGAKESSITYPLFTFSFS